MASSKTVQFDPTQPESEGLVYRSNVAYRSLQIAITFGKILGFLPWSLDTDSEYSGFPYKSFAYQVCVVGIFWLVGITAAIFVLVKASSLEVITSSLSLVLAKGTIIVIIITSTILFCYCIIFSRNFIETLQKWKTLDPIIARKLPVCHFYIAQMLIAIVMFAFVVLRLTMLYFKELQNISDWNLYHSAHTLFITFYLAFLPAYKTCTATFFIFSCWFLALAYSEIQNDLRMMMATKSEPLINALYKTRQAERIVRQLVTETQELFAVPITVVVMGTCFSICVFVYFFATTRQIMFFTDIIFLLVLLVCTVVAADYLNEKHDNLLESVCDLDIDPKDLGLEEQLQLQLLKEKLSKCSVEFTACGFFNINRSLITTIFGVILSYLVVLMQFHKEDKPNVTGIPNITKSATD